jgi:hypothetical protein
MEGEIKPWRAIRWMLLLTVEVTAAGVRDADAATPSPTAVIALSPSTIS